MEKLLSYRFRPDREGSYKHNYPGKSFLIRRPLLTWQVNESLNRATLGRMAGIIHHYSCHAPLKLRARFKQARVRMNKRLPVRGSTRYYCSTTFTGIQ